MNLYHFDQTCSGTLIFKTYLITRGILCMESIKLFMVGTQNIRPTFFDVTFCALVGFKKQIP